MSERKNLRKYFEKCVPDLESAAVLDSGYIVKSRIDRENMLIEVEAEYENIIEKRKLFKTEDLVCRTYKLKSCRIIPKYRSELFDKKYFGEIIEEAKRRNIISRTFLQDYDVEFSDSEITVQIGFGDGALFLIDDAKTAEKISGIINGEFGLTYKIVFKCPDGFVDDSSLSESDFQRYKAETIEMMKKNSPPPKINSINKENCEIKTNGDGIFESGYMKFDTNGAFEIYGSKFDIEPVPLELITRPCKNVVIIGETFGLTVKENFKKTKMTYKFFVQNAKAAVTVLKSIPKKDEGGFPNIPDGTAVAMRGEVILDDKDNDVFFMPDSIMQIKAIPRTDDAPEKRVELHLHTTMSTMDSVLTPNDAVKMAKRFGHRAVAITDHGNVQGYQEAMLEAKAQGEKVIYGMEGYFVNDEARAVFGDKNDSFDGEFVVFDTETTGLSPLNDSIIEIGAVIVKNKQLGDVFKTFINPQRHIPEEATAVNNITDDMLADAPLIGEAIKSFLDFIGERTLVAHNASFDIGFIRKACETCGYEFKNGYADTLSMSRFVNPDLKTHKLDNIAKSYKMGDFEKHRAYQDAEMTARIFIKMLGKFETEGIFDIEGMSRAMIEHTDPVKLKPCHITLLVKNPTGLKNLYKLVSAGYLKYYAKKTPRIPKTLLNEYREGLIIGSACSENEVFKAFLENKTHDETVRIADYYDYLEIQPVSNNTYLLKKDILKNEEDIRNINRKIVALGEELGKPVVATGDVHFAEKYDEIYRKILLAGMKFEGADNNLGLYFKTTDEMLEEFSYLGEEKAREVVITNTNMIADMVADNIVPFPDGTFTPQMDGADENLRKLCYDKAHSLYGDNIPKLVTDRLEKELESIITHGFSVLYMIAQKLVKFSEDQGYLVGSRGSVGSSYVAFMAGISEVNPLIPHYCCPSCKYSDFNVDKSYGSGFDLPDKKCPVCGSDMIGDGQDIPFETFLGFHGDKSPDIDLNFSGEVQGRVHKYTEDLFGHGNVYRAGTIGLLAEKTAYGYVKNYLEDRGYNVGTAETERLMLKCVGVKRTTGQHPGGIVVVPSDKEIYDFCPVQHPADDPGSDIITTHFTFHYLHDTLLKLDELGHDIPTKYKMVEKFTDSSVMDVQMNDPKIYELFLSTSSIGVTPDDIGCPLGTLGLPEFGTGFVQPVVVESKPHNFADLMQISGLTHGTGLWVGNAQDLIKDGTCTVSNVIGTRDSIMLQLIRYGLDNSNAFKIMEFVRKNKKGKPIPDDMVKVMREHHVDAWYIDSLQKIRYMFPKAHAAAYVMSAIRMGWYKIYRPLEFYCAYFSAAPDGFDGVVAMKGIDTISVMLEDIKQKPKAECTQKDDKFYDAMQLAREFLARGLEMLPVDIYKSDAKLFLPEDGKMRLPFITLPGLGETAAENIQASRADGEYFSVEDLKERSGISKTVAEILSVNGALGNLPKTSQLSFF